MRFVLQVFVPDGRGGHAVYASTVEREGAIPEVGVEMRVAGTTWMRVDGISWGGKRTAGNQPVTLMFQRLTYEPVFVDWLEGNGFELARKAIPSRQLPKRRVSM